MWWCVVVASITGAGPWPRSRACPSWTTPPTAPAQQRQGRQSQQQTGPWNVRQTQSGQLDAGQRKTLLFLFPSLFAHLLQMSHRFQQFVHLRPRRELRQQFADLLQIASLSLGAVPQCAEVAQQILPLCFRGMHFGRQCQLLRRRLQCGLYHLRRSILFQQLVHR